MLRVSERMGAVCPGCAAVAAAVDAARSGRESTRVEDAKDRVTKRPILCFYAKKTPCNSVQQEKARVKSSELPHSFWGSPVLEFWTQKITVNCGHHSCSDAVESASHVFPPPHLDAWVTECMSEF